MEFLAEQTKLAGQNFKVKSLKHNLIKYELISGHCVFLQRARRRVFLKLVLVMTSQKMELTPKDLSERVLLASNLRGGTSFN